MSDSDDQQRAASYAISIRQLLLCLFFVGCGLGVWQLPWGTGILSTLCAVFLTLTCAGAAVGAPFGLWMKGAIVGAGAGLVAMLIVAVPFAAFWLGGP